MNAETTDVVERLYEVLVEEIRARRPDLLDESFTVAEIYQNLVPYRSHRDRIGVEMNGDYEHALLRLLAGEGELLQVQSEAARRRLREELDSVHPDTSLYRKFAACEVVLDAGPDGVPGAASPVDDAKAAEPNGITDGGRRTMLAEAHALFGSRGPEEGPTTSREDAGVGAAGSADAADAGSSAVVPPLDSANRKEARIAQRGGASGAPADAAPEEADPPTPPEKSPAGEEAEEDGPDPCAWCRERLPVRDDLRFCPFCGSRMDRIPCPDCGAELEADWHFCVACGSEIAD